MSNIWNIKHGLKNLVEEMEEHGLSPELELAINIKQEELHDKGISYAVVVKGLEYDVSSIEDEIKRLQALKNAKAKVIDRLKETVLEAMQEFNIEKIETPLMKLSIRRSESIEIGLEELIPDNFKKERVSVSIDKVAIKKAIKDGELVPGAVIKENFSLQLK